MKKRYSWIQLFEGTSLTVAMILMMLIITEVSVAAPIESLFDDREPRDL
jgi:hypothetical protein